MTWITRSPCVDPTLCQRGVRVTLTLKDDEVAKSVVRNHREHQQVEQREHMEHHPEAVRLGRVADPLHVGELHRQLRHGYVDPPGNRLRPECLRAVGQPLLNALPHYFGAVVRHHRRRQVVDQLDLCLSGWGARVEEGS